MSPDTPQSSDAAPSASTSGGQNDQEILDELLGAGEKTETAWFTADGRDIQVTLTPITDRQERYDYLSKLPSGWFEAGQKDSIDEVDDMSSLIPDGEGIGALEEVLIQSVENPSYTELDVQDLVKKRMDDNVLTEAALRVIQLSSNANEKQIDGFRTKK